MTSRKKDRITLVVAPSAADRFMRQKVMIQQVVEKELEDGSLIISGKLTHPAQIFSVVRYWLPSVRIVSPASWQQELEAGLRAYLEG